MYVHLYVHMCMYIYIHTSSHVRTRAVCVLTHTRTNLYTCRFPLDAEMRLYIQRYNTNTHRCKYAYVNVRVYDIIHITRKRIVKCAASVKDRQGLGTCRCAYIYVHAYSSIHNRSTCINAYMCTCTTLLTNSTA